MINDFTDDKYANTFGYIYDLEHLRLHLDAQPGKDRWGACVAALYDLINIPKDELDAAFKMLHKTDDPVFVVVIDPARMLVPVSYDVRLIDIADLCGEYGVTLLLATRNSVPQIVGAYYAGIPDIAYQVQNHFCDYSSWQN